jgi:carbon monoxide dehydrogenase subunit G
MKVVGSALLAVERKRVWDALQDPGVLVRTIPGCERLEETGDDAYKMTVAAGVASIKGVYQGEVTLADQHEPERFVLRARGQGAPGTVEATVHVRLSEAEGGTRVDYDAEAVVGGMIGGVGQRMLGSVAKRTAGEFFTAVERHLVSGPVVASGAEVASGEAAAEVAPGAQVFTRPAEPVAQKGTPVWPVLTAFGMGAGIALGSAVIGWLLGRSGRRR